MPTPVSSTLILQSFLTGIAVAAPIGPVNLEMMRRTLRQGPAYGWAVGLGACVIDASMLLAFSLGAGAVLKEPMAQRVFFALGGALLTGLGVGALREAWVLWKRSSGDVQELLAQAGRGGAATPLQCFFLGLVMTAVNPMTLAFWSAFSLEYVNLRAAQRVVAAGAVLVGCLAWVTFVTGLVALARRRAGAKMLAAATAAGGTFLLVYGLRFFWRASAGVG